MQVEFGRGVLDHQRIDSLRAKDCHGETGERFEHAVDSLHGDGDFLLSDLQAFLEAAAYQAAPDHLRLDARAQRVRTHVPVLLETVHPHHRPAARVSSGQAPRK